MSFIIVFFAVFFIVPGLLGYWITINHHKQLKVREQDVAHIVLLTSKAIPANYEVDHGVLVTGCIVMSCGNFKQWLAGWRNLFGGRIGSYEAMVDLARRDSLVRMQEAAERLGANMIINVKIQTVSLAETPGNQQNSMTKFEVLSYGTAVFES